MAARRSGRSRARCTAISRNRPGRGCQPRALLDQSQPWSGAWRGTGVVVRAGAWERTADLALANPGLRDHVLHVVQMAAQLGLGESAIERAPLAQPLSGDRQRGLGELSSELVQTRFPVGGVVFSSVEAMSRHAVPSRRLD